jgi:hypothetical protein
MSADLSFRSRLRAALHRLAVRSWRLAAVGFVLAASCVFAGGLLAGSDRATSDSLVLAGFGLFLPSLALGWVGLLRQTPATH